MLFNFCQTTSRVRCFCSAPWTCSQMVQGLRSGWPHLSVPLCLRNVWPRTVNVCQGDKNPSRCSACWAVGLSYTGNSHAEPAWSGASQLLGFWAMDSAWGHVTSLTGPKQHFWCLQLQKKTFGLWMENSAVWHSSVEPVSSERFLSGKIIVVIWLWSIKYKLDYEINKKCFHFMASVKTIT